MLYFLPFSAIPVQFGSNSYDLFPNIESELCVVADDASPVTASVEVVAVYNGTYVVISISRASS